MEKDKTPEQKYNELKKEILEIKYEPFLKMDWVFEKFACIKKKISTLFPYPDYHNMLYEYYYKQRQELFKECLKHLLIQKKENLKKLPIEYIITSIFSYIFDFDLEKALTSIYGLNFKNVIEHPHDKSDVCIFVHDKNNYGYARTTIVNNLIPKCEIENRSFRNMPMLNFEVIKEEIVKNKRIILMKSKSIYLLDICGKEEDANSILVNTSTNAKYYRNEEEALNCFDQLVKELSSNE